MKINNKSISIAFVIILAATVIISLAGILLMSCLLYTSPSPRDA